MLNKDDNEIVDKIMGKGQVQVRGQLLGSAPAPSALWKGFVTRPTTSVGLTEFI